MFLFWSILYLMLIRHFMCFLKLMFAWYNVFYPSIFIQLMSLYLKWVSFRNHTVGSWFFFFFLVCVFVLIHCTNLCILICVFRPFIFKVTIGILGLKYAILLCIFCLFLLSGSLVSVGYLNFFYDSVLIYSYNLNISFCNIFSCRYWNWNLHT